MAWSHQDKCAIVGVGSTDYYVRGKSWPRTINDMAAEAIISETTRPAPPRFTIWRNGMSVTPDIGARMTGSSIRTGPISTGLRRGVRSMRVISL